MSLSNRLRANSEVAPWVVLEVQNLEQTLRTTQQNNWDLCTAVQEYHAVLNEIHTFINTYLAGGGDATEMPPRWHDLDKLRQVKYANLLQLAGLTS